MSVTKISELGDIGTPASDDELPIVDTSAGTTKKVTVANLHDLPTAPSGIATNTSKEYNLKLTDASDVETLSWVEETIEIADDTSPQLGGNLDVNSNSIVSTSNADINITPNGTGDVVIDGLKYPQADGNDGQVLKTNGSAQLSWVDQTTDTTELADDSSPQLGGMLDVNGNSIGDGTLELLKFSETASAVNEFTITNAATGNAPTLSATGDNTNIDITLTPKGTGEVNISKVNIDAGTITGITDLAVADGGTGVSTLTDGGVLLGSGANAITAMAVLADGEMIVGDGSGDPVAESGSTLRTSIGVAIGTDVQAYDANNATASSTTTFTNKTFNANGTGNSLSNVDVADLADGTDGELITWDASGNPATVSVGTNGQVLTSNGTGAAPTFQDAAGGNTPYFYAYTSARQTISDYTTTKIECDTEAEDSGGNYDPSTNYRFTVPSGQGGKYFVTAGIQFITSGNAVRQTFVYIKKNGSVYADNDWSAGSESGNLNPKRETNFVSHIIDLAATDYIELWGSCDDDEGNSPQVSGFFLGYKIGA